MTGCQKFQYKPTTERQTFSLEHTFVQLFVGGFVSYVHYLCLFAYGGVLFLVFLFVFILCLVYSVLTVPLYCPFFDCPFGVL